MTTPPKSEAGPAIFSECRRYRYSLTRVWAEERGYVVWIMLNPSTADENRLDNTLRRCLRYSHDWGYGGFEIVNLFAHRATDPIAMKAAPEPIGPDNDEHIMAACQRRRTRLVMVGWGAHGKHMGRGRAVLEMLDSINVPLHYLKLTTDGLPCHPLFLPSILTPKEWAS